MKGYAAIDTFSDFSSMTTFNFLSALRCARCDFTRASLTPSASAISAVLSDVMTWVASLLPASKSEAYDYDTPPVVAQVFQKASSLTPKAESL